MTSTSVTFTWLELVCGERNGQINGYSYLLINEAGAVITKDETASTSVSIAKLTPFTNYSFQVSAKTESGIGPASPTLHVVTDEGGL